MRKIWAILIAAGLLVSFSCNVFSQDLKFGYVDILKVFNEYEKTKYYDGNLEDKKNKAESKLREKKETIEKIQNRLGVLKEEEKSKEEEKLKSEIEEYRKIEQEVFTDIKKERDEKMEEIVKDIDKVVEDYAKKNKFNLIINKNAVLYGDSSMDITDEILKIANKNYNSKK